MADALKPSYVVLQQVGEGEYRLVGEVERQPGRTARQARAQAILDATGGTAKPGEVYLAVLRSEWRIAFEYVSERLEQAPADAGPAPSLDGGTAR